jgi:A/G-specific adenine glycosylase
MGFKYLIMHWYETNKRDLPWRRTSDPYRIWVSEIILQQTRVEQGLDYYHRFLEKFPDIESLAMAEEEDVMKVWQGLGYYSRARNMHSSARTIHNVHHSVFPASYEEMRKLKGIGDYSASAISSIVYGAPHPVIDGNVLRLVSRYLGIMEPVNSSPAKKKIKAFLDENIDKDDPGTFNQAAMEMGALVCRPKLALCSECPLSESCYALNNDMVESLPVVTKAKAISIRYFNYLVIINKEDDGIFTWIKKRTGNDIWKNLYDFPLIETVSEISSKGLIQMQEWKDIFDNKPIAIEHSIILPGYKLSHREIRARFFVLNSPDFSGKDFKKIRFTEIHNYPVSRMIEKIIKNISARPGIFQKIPD